MTDAKIHAGSCHCGAVAYTVDTALDELIECNCSHCYRKGFILAFVPPEAFTLTSGEANLTEYRFNQRSIAHLFCKTCGVQPFGRGSTPDGKQMVAVNVRTLSDVAPWTLQAQRVDGASF